MAELLREIAPQIARIGIVRELEGQAGIAQWAVIGAAASPLGVELSPVDVHSDGETKSRLISRGSNRLLAGEYVAEQDGYEATQTVALGAIPEALPEVVHTLLAPMYELFEFFHLPKRLVEEELSSLQRSRF